MTNVFWFFQNEDRFAQVENPLIPRIHPTHQLMDNLSAWTYFWKRTILTPIYQNTLKITIIIGELHDLIPIPTFYLQLTYS